MELVIRVSLFHVLENMLNGVSSPKPCSNADRNSQFGKLESAEHQCPTFYTFYGETWITLNLFNFFIISMCMLLISSCKTNTFLLIKWFLLAVLSFFYLSPDFYNYNLVLSNYSVTLLRVTTHLILCYFIYKQFNAVRSLEIPVATATLFMLLTFDSGSAEFHLAKYFVYTCLIHDMSLSQQPHLKMEKIKVGLIIFFIFFLIQLSSLRCFWTQVEDGGSWSDCLSEFYYIANCAILLRVFIICGLLYTCNRWILRTVNGFIKGLEVPTTTTLISPAYFLVFSVENAAMKGDEYHLLIVYFLINFAAVLIDIQELTKQTLNSTCVTWDQQRLRKALILSCLNCIIAISTLNASPSIVTFSPHRLILTSLCGYVVAMTFVTLLRYAIVSVMPDTCEVDKVANNVELKLKYCLLLCLSLSMFWMSKYNNNNNSFSLLTLIGAVCFTTLLVKRVYFDDQLVSFVRAKMFVYYLPKIGPEILEAFEPAVCTVCYRRMYFGRVTPCDHYFHHNCLLDRLYKSSTCPTCQLQLY